VFVVSFNYLRHVRFSPGPLYRCFVRSSHATTCVVRVQLCNACNFVRFSPVEVMEDAINDNIKSKSST
jgi:hypothetical protein